jgi:hypothetical protein
MWRGQSGRGWWSASGGGGAGRATVGLLEGEDVKAFQGDEVSGSGEGG